MLPKRAFIYKGTWQMRDEEKTELSSEEIPRKCAKCWESMRKYAKYWESVPNESIRACECNISYSNLI